MKRRRLQQPPRRRASSGNSSNSAAASSSSPLFLPSPLTSDSSCLAWQSDFLFGSAAVSGGSKARKLQRKRADDGDGDAAAAAASSALLSLRRRLHGLDAELRQLAVERHSMHRTLQEAERSIVSTQQQALGRRQQQRQQSAPASSQSQSAEAAAASAAVCVQSAPSCSARCTRHSIARCSSGCLSWWRLSLLHASSLLPVCQLVQTEQAEQAGDHSVSEGRQQEEEERRGEETETMLTLRPQALRQTGGSSSAAAKASRAGMRQDSGSASSAVSAPVRSQSLPLLMSRAARPPLACLWPPSPRCSPTLPPVPPPQPAQAAAPAARIPAAPVAAQNGAAAAAQTCSSQSTGSSNTPVQPRAARAVCPAPAASSSPSPPSCGSSSASDAALPPALHSQLVPLSSTLCALPFAGMCRAFAAVFPAPAVPLFASCASSDLQRWMNECGLKSGQQQRMADTLTACFKHTLAASQSSSAVAASSSASAAAASSSSASLSALTARIRHFIRQSPALYLQCLLLQPLELSSLFLCCQGAGIDVSRDQLQLILDAEGCSAAQTTISRRGGGSRQSKKQRTR